MATVPVHVVTGFLGSGKSTLINATMRAGFGAGTAVVVNEFGDIGLDQTFIQAASEEVIVLKNGCVCCKVREDLGLTLMQLAAMRDRSLPLNRVLIETSGISDPLPILQTLGSDFALRARFHAGSVICTADALNSPVGRLATFESTAQITAADALVLTKADLVDEAARAAVAAGLEAMHPDAEFIAGTGPAVAEFILAREASPQHGFHRDFSLRKGAERSHAVSSIVVRDAAPRSWSAFVVWLTAVLHVHGDLILRTKGILYDAATENWIGIHGVRRFLHAPVHLGLQAPPPGGSSLVFITQGLDPARIERSYHRHVRGPDSAAA